MLAGISVHGVDSRPRTQKAGDRVGGSNGVAEGQRGVSSPSETPAENAGPPRRGLPRSYRVVAIGLAVAIAVMVVAGIVLTEYYHGTPVNQSPDLTLAPVGWAVVTLAYEQFADIGFVNHATENLNGSFESENTITSFVMNSTDFFYLVKWNVVDGYVWTSGQVWTGNINYTVAPGNWDLVFQDTNKYGSSGVAITQAVVLTPT
jgi:hypothetical protein